MDASERTFIEYSVPRDDFQSQLDKYHNYDQDWCVWRHFHRRRIDAVRRLLTKYLTIDLDKCVALDLGCGKGPISVLLSALGVRQVYGVDSDVRELILAEEWVAKNGRRNVEFCNEPIESLRLPDDHFDLIICSEVLEHLAAIGPALDTIESKLKSGGLVVISMPNVLSGYYFGLLLGFLFRRMVLRNVPYPTELVKHFRHTYWSIYKLLKSRYGLQMVHKEGVFLWPLPARIISVIGRRAPAMISAFDWIEDSFLRRFLPFMGASTFMVLRKR